ncbi:MAG: thiamine pyrophosphate-dependent enzyme [Sphingobacteriia bacterium]
MATRSLLSIDYQRGDLSNEELIQLYRAILLPRMIEEKMLILLRQNKISKWFSGIGQEAVSVGLTQALNAADFIYPLHRNLGVFTSRNVPLQQLFEQWQGKPGGFTKGRDRSFHFGTEQHRIIGMISHLGAMLGVADGTSLASNLQGQDFISVAFSGDGGASEGAFHEALNTAAVWQLPVLFVVENNGYGLSTPSHEQFRCKQFIDKGIGYGMEAVQVDGNNLLEVYRTARRLVARMRVERKPILLEAMTFRMRGHEEASGTKYVPQALMDEWAQKDPVQNYEGYLLETGVLSEQDVADIRKETRDQINLNWKQAMAAPDVAPNLAAELGDVYPALDVPEVQPTGPEPERRFVDAISEGLRQSMERHPELVLMGQDIADYGGVFKITDGFTEAFGKERVRNTPLCESAIVGAAFGLSLAGHRAMVEMQFADFVSCGFNQIVNNLAKNHYRWGHAPRVVVRMPTGAGVAAGPFHSQSNEAWFFHTPGLVICYPSNPYDAKGLLNSALAYGGPALYFEHKKLYRSLSGPVPTAYYTLPLGQARVVRSGQDATIVTYGMGVHWAQAAVEALKADVEIIDLRTLVPWDRETVYASIRKTGKVLMLHEDTLTGGIGAEWAACVAEDLFEQLDGPIMRVGSLDSPVPFHAALEEQFLPEARLREKLESLLGY